MNKKLLAIGSGIVIGTMMLGTTALTAWAGNSGYDTYKTAFKNTASAKSITMKSEISVQDNGKLLLSVDSTSKTDKANRSMSDHSTIVGGGQQNGADVYQQDGKLIYKSSDSEIYNEIDHKFPRGKFGKGGGKEQSAKNGELENSRVKDIENVVDALAGNIQDYITLKDNGDGTKNVSLQLSENQVSPVINAAASLAVKHIEGKVNHNGDFKVGHGGEAADQLVKELKGAIPELKDNIRVAKVAVNAKINQDNFIQTQTQNITISGTDVNGQTHDVVVSIKTDFSGYNSTTPDTIDLSGKQVKVMNDAKRHFAGKQD